MDILGLLETKRCYLCGGFDSEGVGLCAYCRGALRRSEAPVGQRCPRCFMPLFAKARCSFCALLPEDLDILYSHGYFSGTLKELLNAYKAGRSPGLRFVFADWLYRAFTEQGWQDCPVVPVPPRRGKIRRTGWDQVDLICRVLKRRYGMRVLKCLKRNDRLQQKTLAFAERKTHMEHNLYFSKARARDLNVPRGRKVILLDDVFTSGATLRAAARLIRGRCGAEIIGAVLCRVV